MLISEASGKTLRIKDNGEVEGKGGEGTMGIINNSQTYTYSSAYIRWRFMSNLTVILSG